MKPLTLKQSLFVESYEGNGVKAAKAAGYKGSPAVLAQTAYELLRNPDIHLAIDVRSRGEMATIIADRSARQKFWTDIMNDSSACLRDRLRASELLGKSEADFRDRVELSSRQTLGQLIEASWKDDTELFDQPSS